MLTWIQLIPAAKYPKLKHQANLNECSRVRAWI
jgi:hypothetical protein